jgi:hypothetical protein
VALVAPLFLLLSDCKVKQKDEVEDPREELMALINEYRVSTGLPPFVFDQDVATHAQRYAELLAGVPPAYYFPYRVDADGLSLVDRLQTTDPVMQLKDPPEQHCVEVGCADPFCTTADEFFNLYIMPSGIADAPITDYDEIGIGYVAPPPFPDVIANYYWILDAVAKMVP